MSVETMAAVFNMNIGDPTRKLIVLGLANHAHKDGTCAWAGVGTLAEYANCSTRTVQRHLATALADGFIREGDQSVVDQRIPARYRPIAYEVAMSEETAASWAADRQLGRRDVAAAYGQVGGVKAAKKVRGDNLSPLVEGALDGTAEPVIVRGDNMTPLVGDPSGVTPVTFRGDTGDALGVTPVSPKPSFKPPTEPPRKDIFVNADASTADDEGSEPLLLINPDPTPPPGFDDFWKVYPRKVGKQDALRKWNAAIKAHVPAQVIVDAASRLAADPNLPKGAEVCFIPHPATWLNRGQWEDGPLPPRSGGRFEVYSDEAVWGDRSGYDPAEQTLTDEEIAAMYAPQPDPREQQHRMASGE